MKVIIDIDDELLACVINGVVSEDQRCHVCDKVREGRMIDGRPCLLVNGASLFLDPRYIDALLLVDSRISFAQGINRMMENLGSKPEYDVDNMSARDLEKAFPDIPAPKYDGDRGIVYGPPHVPFYKNGEMLTPSEQAKKQYYVDPEELRKALNGEENNNGSN